ncbi:MAG TPA: hypothetical protein PKD85_13275, partial [Saprospiraceae bacterium]|nr:hypothetical protein [Saprospiraceae bacterium]
LQRDSRISTLIGLIAISYTWMLITGLIIKKKQPEIFKTKKHRRPSKSVFKAGLEFIMRAVFTNNSKDFAIAIKFLSCT